MNAVEQVLDHGVIVLVDHMGNDAAVCDAARASTGRSSKGPESDRRLVEYLVSHGHWTPFEMCELKFYVRAPIFVAREWFRHRSGHFNERSLRYSEADPWTYTPTEFRTQHDRNRQSSAGQLLGESHDTAQFAWEHAVDGASTVVEELRGLGVARELANRLVPLAGYTVFYWKVDLRNCLAFLQLRTAPDAQWEIRQYALVVERTVQTLFPVTYAAWVEHVKHAVTLTASEVAALVVCRELGPVESVDGHVAERAVETAAYERLKAATTSRAAG